MGSPASRRREGADADAVPPFEAFLSFRLHHLVSVNERAASAQYERLFGITLNDWRLLALLARHERLTVKQLARLTDLDKSRVSRIAAALCERGWLQREANAEDGRSVLLALSAEGRRHFRRIYPVSLSRQERLLGCLDEQERVLFERALAKLDGQAQAMFEEERRARQASATRR